MRFLIILIASLTLTVGAALACSCVGFATPADQAANADAIFRGRVISSTPLPGYEDTARVTTFALVSPLKMPAQWGAPPDTIEVAHGVDGAGCGIQFPRDRDILVIAHMGQDRQLHTNTCMAPQWPEEAYRRALHLLP